MPRPYSMGTRGQATEATRSRLLNATVDVLADVGVDALTVQAVAQRADVALRTVYNHFPSKEALLVEAYTRLAQVTRDAVAALPDDGTPRQRLHRFVHAFYDSLEHENVRAAVILAISGYPDLDAKVAEVRAWRRRELTALLKAAEQDRALALPLRQAVALAFLLTAYATWRSIVDESGVTPAAAKALTVRTLDAAVFGIVEP